MAHGVTRNVGYQAYDSTATNRYTPEVYSGKLVLKFYANTVFGEIASTEYEGEIKGFGDNIIIRTTPDVSVFDYVIGSQFSPSDYQTPASAAVELNINKAKAFLTKINTVDRITADLDLASMFADDASEQLKIVVDRDILANIPTQVDAANQGATAGVISVNVNLGTSAAPVSVTATNAVDVILNHAQVLDEQNVSDEGRWIVLPSWYIQRLKLSPLKNANETGDSVSTIRNGAVGMIDRFTVYRSNLLTVTDAATDHTNIVAGHSSGLAFAAQVSEMEQLPNPADFGTLMRGLLVYGYKVIAPKYLTWGKVYAG